MSELPKLSLAGNYLKAGNKFLVAEDVSDEEKSRIDKKKERLVTPDELGSILTLGGEAIRVAMEEFRANMAAKNPNSQIKLPWVNTVRLGELGQETRILTDAGEDQKYKKENYTEHGLTGIIPLLRPYFESAADTTFGVRVQSNLEGWDRIHNGTWLQIHANKDEMITSGNKKDIPS